MFLLRKNTFQLESRTPLVTSEEAAAVVQAEEVIAAAQREAEAILAEAKNAYQAEKERGYADGIANGKEEILLQKMELLDETIAYMEGVEGKMVELVLKALKKCIAEIGEEELVFQIVHKAMQALIRTQRQILLRVSPKMAPVVNGRIGELKKDFPLVVSITVQEDGNLADTACVVETEAGMVEASIDGQLDAIRKSIERHFQR